MADKLDLENFKEEYNKIQEKYDLPSFEELNSDFAIEKAADNETEYLVREIRRYVSDKLFNYLKLISLRIIE